MTTSTSDITASRSSKAVSALREMGDDHMRGMLWKYSISEVVLEGSLRRQGMLHAMLMLMHDLGC